MIIFYTQPTRSHIGNLCSASNQSAICQEVKPAMESHAKFDNNVYVDNELLMTSRQHYIWQPSCLHNIQHHQHKCYFHGQSFWELQEAKRPRLSSECGKVGKTFSSLYRQCIFVPIPTPLFYQERSTTDCIYSFCLPIRYWTVPKVKVIDKRYWCWHRTALKFLECLGWFLTSGILFQP